MARSNSTRDASCRLPHASTPAAEFRSGPEARARGASSPADRPPGEPARTASGAMHAGEGGAAGDAAELDEVRWRLLLCGSTPREVLARIVRDDPLRLRRRIGRRLVERSLLLDADEVLLRTLARVAHASGRYQGRPELAAWLQAHVDRAIDACLRESGAADAGHDGRGALAQLAPPLQLDPAAVARACRAFNQMDEELRNAFFRAVLARGASASRSSELATARAARLALEQLLAPLDAARASLPGAGTSPSATQGPAAATKDPAARPLGAARGAGSLRSPAAVPARVERGAEPAAMRRLPAKETRRGT